MELQEFITKTLDAIMHGVRSAQGPQKSNHGGKVSPAGLSAQPMPGVPYAVEGDDFVHTIEFDVAVTTSEGTQTKGGAGIVVGSVSLGKHGQSDASNVSVSRIKFTVPGVFPHGWVLTS